jgi:hypothetical protein
MDHLDRNKNKRKEPEPSQPETPTKIADRSGLGAERGVSPKGGRSLSYRNLGVLIGCTLDEGSSSGSRITSQDKKYEDQGLTTPKASTSGVVVSGTEPGYDRMGECFRSLWLGPASCGPLFLSPSDVDIGDTRERESEPAEASRGMCRYRRSIGFPLTYTSREESP